MKTLVYNYIASLIEVLKQANSLAVSMRESGLIIEYKPDHSPLTNADISVNDLLISSLRSISDFPILSEESTKSDFKSEKTIWIIDPIDGTRPYISGKDDFAICIALVQDGEPILGIISIPTEKKITIGINLPDYKECFSVCYDEHTTTHTSINPINIDENREFTILAGKPLPREFDKFPIAKKVVIFPSATKFVSLAEGEGDAYIRIGHRQMDWDIAAGQAILESAGISLVGLSGERISYPNKDFECPPFIATKRYQDELLDFIKGKF